MNLMAWHRDMATMRYSQLVRSPRVSAWVLIVTISFIVAHQAVVYAQSKAPDVYAGPDFAYSTIPVRESPPPPPKTQSDDEEPYGIFAGILALFEAIANFIQSFLGLFGLNFFGSGETGDTSRSSYDSHSTSVSSDSQRSGHSSTTSDISSFSTK